jgi:hypothetical protein
MSNFIKRIDDFFREKLGNYRETPPPEAWDELEARLDGLKPAPAGGQYRWMVHFALVSLILILSVSVGRKFFGNGTAENGNIALNDNPAKNTTAAEIIASGSKTETGGTVNAGTTVAGQTVTDDKTPDGGGDKGNVSTPLANNSSKTSTEVKSGKTSASGNKVNSKTGNNNSLVTNKDRKINNNSNYKGTLSKPAPEEKGNENNEVQAASPNTTLSVVSKPEVQAKVTKKEAPANKPSASIAAKNSNTRDKPCFPRFEAGVKAGYEGGFSDGAAKKFAIAPYAQCNLSSKFSVMLQPGIIAATINGRTLGNPETYYSATPDNLQRTQSSRPDTVIVGSTSSYRAHVDVYHYSQPHDSIIKSGRIGGTTMEFELPILVKYNISKKFSGYGGVNLVYSKLTSIKENTYVQKGITRSFDTTVFTEIHQVRQEPFSGFNYSGAPISDYKGPLVASHSGYQFNMGYMLGFTYSLNEKWLIDAMLKRTYVPGDVKGGYNINTAQSATYFRLSIGYKFLK